MEVFSCYIEPYHWQVEVLAGIRLTASLSSSTTSQFRGKYIFSGDYICSPIIVSNRLKNSSNSNNT